MGSADKDFNQLSNKGQQQTGRRGYHLQKRCIKIITCLGQIRILQDLSLCSCHVQCMWFQMCSSSFFAAHSQLKEYLCLVFGEELSRPCLRGPWGRGEVANAGFACQLAAPSPPCAEFAVYRAAFCHVLSWQQCANNSSPFYPPDVLQKLVCFAWKLPVILQQLVSGCFIFFSI